MLLEQRRQAAGEEGRGWGVMVVMSVVEEPGDAHMHTHTLPEWFASTQTHTLHHTQLTLLISSSELSSIVRARRHPLVPDNLEIPNPDKLDLR